MNHEIKILFVNARHAVRSCSWAMRRRARATLSCPPPAPGQVYPAEQEIAAEHRELERRPAYFRPETLVLLALALISGITAYLLPAAAGLHGFGLYALILLLGGCSLIATYWAIWRRHGPAYISPARWLLAQQRLTDAGDRGRPPPTFRLWLLLFALVAVDGYLAGTSVVRLFENWLTPWWATFWAVIWGVAVTVGLLELVKVASKEAVIADRRLSAHRLLSGTTQERIRAERMQTQVGDVLGHDYRHGVGRILARTTLAVAVVLLATGTYILRTLPGNIETSQPIAYRHALYTPAIDDRPPSLTSIDPDGNRVGSALIGLFFVLSTLATYLVVRGRTSVAPDATMDHAVLERFGSLDELEAFHDHHKLAIEALADHRLAKFRRALAGICSRLDPRRAAQYPPALAHYKDLVPEHDRRGDSGSDRS